jgi:hypothetical protein
MPGRGNTTSALHKSPGPGAYHSEPSGRNKIAASMKSRHYDKPDSYQPGPGAYKLGDTIGGASNSPSYTMRPRHTPKSASEDVPGPGAYSLASTIGTAPAMSITARRNIKGFSDSVPGPGAYKLEGYTGRDGAKYTLRPKTNVPADLANSPGPGAYNHDTHKGKGPKITMAPKLNVAGFTDANPGPGAYSSPFEVGKEAPKYSMPGRGNPSLSLNKSPGPGAYHTEPSGRNVLGASMKSRHYDKPDHYIPGPGAYNAEAGLTIGSNAPKVSMHKKLGDYTYASSTNPPFLAQR